MTAGPKKSGYAIMHIAALIKVLIIWINHPKGKKPTVHVK